MQYSRHVWEQLKNLTADDLISALERDGWKRDEGDGALIPFIDPATRNRVIIHYHPRKTFGPKLLKALLEDIGWKENDLARLRLIAGRRQKAVGERIAEVGDENPNGQLFSRETEQPGTDHNQYVWELLCRHCGTRYGANGSDFHHRKCPACQGGAPGIPMVRA